ncbi:alpha-amylase [Streptomyces sp. NPDC057280]|uniref:alpha-amylase n=1 Tax=Streptomyces sp. NPDC057280 TaxID=3346081 RepID=UPI0036343C59
MTTRIAQISRHTALATMTTAGLLLITAHPAGAATEIPAPSCVEYYQSWRYTDVHNGCQDTVAVTVEYTDHQWAPCRVLDPGNWATFSGYGPNGNYVTGLWTCTPDRVGADNP